MLCRTAHTMEREDQQWRVSSNKITECNAKDDLCNDWKIRREVRNVTSDMVMFPSSFPGSSPSTSPATFVRRRMDKVGTYFPWINANWSNSVNLGYLGIRRCKVQGHHSHLCLWFWLSFNSWTRSDSDSKDSWSSDVDQLPDPHLLDGSRIFVEWIDEGAKDMTLKWKWGFFSRKSGHTGCIEQTYCWMGWISWFCRCLEWRIDSSSTLMSTSNFKNIQKIKIQILCRSKLNGSFFFVGSFIRVFDRGQNNCHFDLTVKNTNVPQFFFSRHRLVLSGTIKYYDGRIKWFLFSMGPP